MDARATGTIAITYVDVYVPIGTCSVGGWTDRCTQSEGRGRVAVTEEERCTPLVAGWMWARPGEKRSRELERGVRMDGEEDALHCRWECAAFYDGRFFQLKRYQLHVRTSTHHSQQRRRSSCTSILYKRLLCRVIAARERGAGAGLDGRAD